MTCPTKLILDAGAKLLREPEHRPWATLEPQDAEILELLRREGISMELLWVPSPSDPLTESTAGNLVATLYGEKDLAADLGRVLQDLEIYLQDPIYAERDVWYWNPHRFHKDASIRTPSLKQELQMDGMVKRLDASMSNILADFVSEDALPETEGSLDLLTDLKP